MIQKTFLLFVLSLCLSVSAISQTQKGRIQAGGAFSIDFNNRANLGQNSLSAFISGSGLYFITDHFGIGTDLGINISDQNLEQQASGISIGFNGGLQLAYYFGSGKAQPFASTSFHYGKSGNNASPPFWNYSSSYWDITMSAGYSIFIRDNMSIEISIPFRYEKGESELTSFIIDPNNNYTPSTTNSSFINRSIGNRIGLKMYLK